MFCLKCGTENPPDAEYCQGCGAKLKSSKQPQNKKVNIRMIIIIIAAAAAAAVIGVFAFMSVGGGLEKVSETYASSDGTETDEKDAIQAENDEIQDIEDEIAAEEEVDVNNEEHEIVTVSGIIMFNEDDTPDYLLTSIGPEYKIWFEDGIDIGDGTIINEAEVCFDESLANTNDLFDFCNEGGTFVGYFTDAEHEEGETVIRDGKTYTYSQTNGPYRFVITGFTNGSESTDLLTVEQAYQGVYNYLEAQGFDFDEVYEYNGYLTAGETSDSEYTVIFKSYTGAFQYFYVNKETGYTYITEYVPGIVDEETDTGVSFYIWDYLSDNAAVASESLDDEAAATWEVIQKYGISDYGFSRSADSEPYMVFYIDEDSIEDCGDYYSATVRLEYGLEMTLSELQDLEAGDEITLETNSIEGEEETTTFVCYDGLDNPFYNGYEGICLVKKGIEYNEFSAYFPVEDEQTGKVGFHGEIHDEYIRQIFYKGKLRIKKDALYCENMLVSGIWSEQDEERHYAENIWKNDGYNYDYEGYETFKTFSVSDLSQDYNSGFNYVGFTDDGYVIILSNVYS